MGDKAVSKTPRRRGAIPRSTTHTLLAGERLFRVYAQPLGGPSRAYSFNPDSAGRASPVLDSRGDADPAMYVAVNDPHCAIRELLFHTVLKRYARGSTIPAAMFDELYIASLLLLLPIDVVSIQSASQAGLVRPGFDTPRLGSYADTRADAQRLYDGHAAAGGIAWPSAHGTSTAAVLYESRIDKSALQVESAPVRLRDHRDLWDFTLRYLATNDIRVSTP